MAQNKQLLLEALKKSEELERQKGQALRDFEALKRGQDILQQKHEEEQLPDEEEAEKEIA